MVIPAVLTKKNLGRFSYRTPGYWYGMDKEIENLVKTSKNCALAAKTKTDKLWSRLTMPAQ